MGESVSFQVQVVVIVIVVGVVAAVVVPSLATRKKRLAGLGILYAFKLSTPALMDDGGLPCQIEDRI